MCAGCECRVADDRLCIRMRMIGVAIDNPVLPEVAKAAITKPVIVSRRQVAPKLIDSDLQNQLGLRVRDFLRTADTRRRQ